MSSTLDRFEALLVSVDPEATKYEGNGKTDYTVWHPYMRSGLYGDDTTVEELWRVQVDRFCKSDDDAVAVALLAAFDAAEDVVCAYSVDYEPETGYIHHIYTCEVV